MGIEDLVKEKGLHIAEGILLCSMRLKYIIKMDYKPDNIVESKVKWNEICSMCGYRDSFKKMKRRLCQKEILCDHGKSLRPVCSLTKDGLLLAEYFIKVIRGSTDEESKKYNKFLDRVDPDSWMK